MVEDPRRGATTNAYYGGVASQLAAGGRRPAHRRVSRPGVGLLSPARQLHPRGLLHSTATTRVWAAGLLQPAKCTQANLNQALCPKRVVVVPPSSLGPPSPPWAALQESSSLV